MARGFKTGGRKRGSKNKRTEKLNQAVEEVAAVVAKALGLEAFEGDAHAFLMLIYKNEKAPLDLRLEAAKAAIRFEKPALGAVETKNETTIRYVARLPNKEPDAQAWEAKQARQWGQTIQ
jgi:hypothetical protein